MVELDHMIKNDVFQNMTDIKDKNQNIIFAGGYDAYYADICKKFAPSNGSRDSPDGQSDSKICAEGAKPIDIIYDPDLQDYSDLTVYDSDAQLIS